MNFKTQLIFLMLTLTSVSISFAQNLQKHQWKERVLLITAEDSIQRSEQLLELKKDIKGLNERRLIVYVITPFWYSEGIHNSQWIDNKSFYSDIKKTRKKFEVILIGLDGGVKLRQTKMLTRQKLFTLIDGMPMRQSEIKKQKN